MYYRLDEMKFKKDEKRTCFENICINLETRAPFSVITNWIKIQDKHS